MDRLSQTNLPDGGRSPQSNPARSGEFWTCKSDGPTLRVRIWSAGRRRGARGSGFDLEEERLKHECRRREHTTAWSLPPSCAPRPEFSSGRGLPRVPMMNAAHARLRDQLRPDRPHFDCPAARRILAQPIMSPVCVVVGHVLSGQAPDVRFVQRDYVIETIPACTADPALCDAVLPRTAHARSHGFDAGGAQETDHLRAELRVAIQNDVAVTIRIRECLAKLLHDPLGRRVHGHVEMQNPGAAVLDGEAAGTRTGGGR